MVRLMCELSKLPNIGSEIEHQPVLFGISTYEELNAAGTEHAQLRLRALDSTACIPRLLAIEGAVQGIRKTAFSPERKAELMTFLEAHKNRKNKAS